MALVPVPQGERSICPSPKTTTLRASARGSRAGPQNSTRSTVRMWGRSGWAIPPAALSASRISAPRAVSRSLSAASSATPASSASTSAKKFPPKAMSAWTVRPSERATGTPSR